MANSSKDKQENIAKHIAIIMDGNGRWAISNSLKISKGHSKGVEIVRDIVEESVKQNISSLTLYAFSSENWSRPKPEIDAIKKLVVKAINEQVPDLKKQKVKLKFFGEIEDFGSKVLSKIEEAEAVTNEYEPVLNLNIALGYGGRQDIVNLTKKISSKVKDGLLTLEQIDENMISEFSSSPVEDVDLLIRTGGERRISNFLLYQIAYTEILFVNKYWPDFTKEDFVECIDNFKTVSRRFGKRI
jgi:undecaprenyl diphosphate synthase